MKAGTYGSVAERVFIKKVNRMDYRTHSTEIKDLKRKALLLTNAIANAGF